MPTDIIYVPNPADLPKFLKEIPRLGIPPKVTAAYMKKVGFTSSNHSYIPAALMKLGFIDGSGSPTDRWKRYRDTSRQRSVLAEAIRESYAGLFATFPDADKRDDEALRNYFRANTEAAAATLQRAVGTFKALVANADMASAQPPESSQTPSSADVSLPTGDGATKRGSRSTAVPAVNINIQLQLPETDKPEVYDNFFAAMRKHLFE